ELALTDDEILALHQARALWTKTPVEDAIHAALARITATQPTVRPIGGAQLAPNQALLTELVSAAREQSPIGFRYRTVGHRDITYRHLRPWAVLMAHQHWYVVGWDLDRQDERIFRLSRIESNTVTSLPARALAGRNTASLRPHDFSVAAIRARLNTEHPAAEAYLWITENTVSQLRVRAQTVERKNGWDLLHFQYRDPFKVAASIAALTTEAQVDTRNGTELAELVDDITAIVRDAHAGAP